MTVSLWVPQVSRRLQGALEELAASRREAEDQACALRRGCGEREEQVKTRAALEVQLSSTERRAWGLTQDLAAVRSGSGVCVCVCVCACVYVLSRNTHLSECCWFEVSVAGLKCVLLV